MCLRLRVNSSCTYSYTIDMISRGSTVRKMSHFNMNGGFICAIIYMAL